MTQRRGTPSQPHRPAGRSTPRSTTRSASTVDPARRAAYDVLHEVGSSEGYSNLVIRQVLAESRLHGRDAAFATELVMGVLRRRGTLDEVLARCVDRPLPKLDPRLLDILRLGAYQLLFLDTPPHAAVDSSVELAGAVAGPRPRGLVNAVLRRVAAKPYDDWLQLLLAQHRQPVAALACEHSHPQWVVSALRDALGGDDDALTALLQRNNETPPVTLAARWCEPAELLEQPDTEPGLWSPWAVRLRHGRPGDLEQVRRQTAGVQDEGSQLMVHALLEAPLTGPDSRWLDMCSGPGGKAALLAAQADRHEAKVLAVELRTARARLVQRALANARGTWGVVQADATCGPWSPGSFDRVLLDAPCTGLGVVRRRPESRWRRTPADVAALAGLQRALLHSALDAVRVGGVVAYVTCSPHIAETDLVVDDVMRTRDDIEELDAAATMPAGMPLAPGPRLRLWPHIHDTDGMFCALLRRV